MSGHGMPSDEGTTVARTLRERQQTESLHTDHTHPMERDVAQVLGHRDGEAAVIAGEHRSGLVVARDSIDVPSESSAASVSDQLHPRPYHAGANEASAANGLSSPTPSASTAAPTVIAATNCRADLTCPVCAQLFRQTTEAEMERHVEECLSAGVLQEEVQRMQGMAQRLHARTPSPTPSPSPSPPPPQPVTLTQDPSRPSRQEAFQRYQERMRWRQSRFREEEEHEGEWVVDESAAQEGAHTEEREEREEGTDREGRVEREPTLHRDEDDSLPYEPSPASLESWRRIRDSVSMRGSRNLARVRQAALPRPSPPPPYNPEQRRLGVPRPLREFPEVPSSSPQREDVEIERDWRDLHALVTQAEHAPAAHLASDYLTRAWEQPQEPAAGHQAHAPGPPGCARPAQHASGPFYAHHPIRFVPETSGSPRPSQQQQQQDQRHITSFFHPQWPGHSHFASGSTHPASSSSSSAPSNPKTGSVLAEPARSPMQESRRPTYDQEFSTVEARLRERIRTMRTTLGLDTNTSASATPMWVPHGGSSLPCPSPSSASSSSIAPSSSWPPSRMPQESPYLPSVSSSSGSSAFTPRRSENASTTGSTLEAPSTPPGGYFDLQRRNFPRVRAQANTTATAGPSTRQVSRQTTPLEDFLGCPTFPSAYRSPFHSSSSLPFAAAEPVATEPSTHADGSSEVRERVERDDFTYSPVVSPSASPEHPSRASVEPFTRPAPEFYDLTGDSHDSEPSQGPMEASVSSSGPSGPSFSSSLASEPSALASASANEEGEDDYRPSSPCPGAPVPRRRAFTESYVRWRPPSPTFLPHTPPATPPRHPQHTADPFSPEADDTASAGGARASEAFGSSAAEPIVCPYSTCERVLAADEFAAHVHAQHADERDQALRCPLCARRYTSSERLGLGSTYRVTHRTNLYRHVLGYHLGPRERTPSPPSPPQPFASSYASSSASASLRRVHMPWMVPPPSLPSAPGPQQQQQTPSGSSSPFRFWQHPARAEPTPPVLSPSAPPQHELPPPQPPVSEDDAPSASADYGLEGREHGSERQRRHFSEHPPRHPAEPATAPFPAPRFLFGPSWYHGWRGPAPGMGMMPPYPSYEYHASSSAFAARLQRSSGGAGRFWLPAGEAAFGEDVFAWMQEVNGLPGYYSHKHAREEEEETPLYAEETIRADLPGKECAICFEGLLAGECVARLACLCVYHKTCILTWFTKAKTCPLHRDTKLKQLEEEGLRMSGGSAEDEDAESGESPLKKPRTATTSNSSTSGSTVEMSETVTVVL